MPAEGAGLRPAAGSLNMATVGLVLRRSSGRLAVAAVLVLSTRSVEAQAQTEGGAAQWCRTIAMEASKGTNATLLTRAKFAGPVREAIARAGLTRVEPGQGPDVTLLVDETYHPTPRNADNWAHASLSITVRLVRRFLPDVEIVRCPACKSDRSRSGPPAEEGLWDAAMLALFGVNGGLGKLWQDLTSRTAGVRLLSQEPAEFRLDSFGKDEDWQPLPDQGLVLRCMKAGDVVDGTVRHDRAQKPFSMPAPGEYAFVWPKPIVEEVRDAGPAAADAGPSPGPGWIEAHAVPAIGLVFVIAVASLVVVVRTRTTRVAFLGSSPRAGYTELLVAKEQTSLELMPRGRGVTVHALANTTFSNVVTLFARIDPEIVHFAGHGQGEELVFQDGEGRALPVDVAFIQRLFATRRSTRLIVLNACDTEPLARSVMRSGCVAVGWTGEVDDDAALQFTTTLYRCIFSGESAAAAFKLAEVEYDAGGQSPDRAKPRLVEAVSGDAARCVPTRRLWGL